MKSMLSMALAAVSVVLTVASAQADPALFIGLQQDGVNGGAITIYTAPPIPFGTFSQTNNSGIGNPGADTVEGGSVGSNAQVIDRRSAAAADRDATLD